MSDFINSKPQTLILRYLIFHVERFYKLFCLSGSFAVKPLYNHCTHLMVIVVFCLFKGGKVLKMEANDNVVKIIDPNGKSIDVNEETEKHLTPSRQQMLQHFHQASSFQQQRELYYNCTYCLKVILLCLTISIHLIFFV